MMPDPLAHHPSMLRISEDLPRLWWLNPWGMALRLHRSVTALKTLADLDDRVIQSLDDVHRENLQLKHRIAYMRFAGDALVRVCEEHAPGLYSKQEVSRWAAACDE